MNLYLDCEFTGLHQHTTLISLALVADDGQTFYAEFDDYNVCQCDDWIEENVLAHTRWLKHPKNKPGNWQEGQIKLSFGDTMHIKTALVDWLDKFTEINVWADCLAWDWVLFCQLFGGAHSLPLQIFYLPFDLVTLCHCKGVDPDTDRLLLAGDFSYNGQRHNALYDAYLLQACYHQLNNT